MPEPCSAAAATYRAAPLITAHKAARATACRAAQDGWNSLIAASENGHVKTIELLLDRHANINAADEVMRATRMCRLAEGRQALRAAGARLALGSGARFGPPLGAGRATRKLGRSWCARRAAPREDLRGCSTYA